jgi:hypothetical protein
MAIPFLNHITLNQNEARDFGMHLTEAGDIGSPVAGQLIFDNGTGQDVMKYYDGSAWITVGSDNYVDGASFASNTLTLTRTGTLSDLTVDLSSLNTSFTLDGDNGTPQTISSGNTLTISGGPVIVTTVAATDELVVKHDVVSRTNTTSTASPAFGATFTAIDSVTSSTEGHITGVNTKTVTLPTPTAPSDAQITIEAGTYLSLGTGQDGIFTLNQSGAETITLDHDSTSRTNNTSSASPNHGASFTAIDSITTNATGHVTAVNTKTVTLPADNNTDTLQSIAADTSNNDRFITTVASASGAQTGFSHSTLKYNPSTETLSVTNLIVSGTSTTINTETINLADNIITLNSNYSGSTPTENAGIEVERGTLDNVQLNWDESDDDWEFTAYDHQTTPALTTYKIPRTYSTTVGGSTSIAVNHYLGTRNVIVQLFDTSSYETVYADVVRTNTNTVTLTFASAPSAGDITVLISTAGA